MKPTWLAVRFKTIKGRLQTFKQNHPALAGWFLYCRINSTTGLSAQAGIV